MGSEGLKSGRELSFVREGGGALVWGLPSSACEIVRYTSVPLHNNIFAMRLIVRRTGKEKPRSHTSVETNMVQHVSMTMS